MSEFLSPSTPTVSAPTNVFETVFDIFMLIVFASVAAFMLGMVSTTIDMLYGGWVLAGVHPISALFANPLETMNGWEEIADENPVVYEGFTAYYVKTDDWIYKTTLRTTPEVESFLETLVVH